MQFHKCPSAYYGIVSAKFPEQIQMVPAMAIDADTLGVMFPSGKIH